MNQSNMEQAVRDQLKTDNYVKRSIWKWFKPTYSEICKVLNVPEGEKRMTKLKDELLWVRCLELLGDESGCHMVDNKFTFLSLQAIEKKYPIQLEEAEANKRKKLFKKIKRKINLQYEEPFYDNIYNQRIQMGLK
ncbi:hypothetical protein OXYTRIMIC_120 [Oxytricha trifallax]|uniref:Uncharacterized protein n=1 Tax=Oxytricha trifallax TaxID=1172189 RepID=A0A073HZL1_9SPIT|nr:hypothetical protein OXYTRIMIC_120 [Oxytricha trifallax]